MVSKGADVLTEYIPICIPGSVALYAPGKETRGPGVPLPPPVTVI